MTGRSPPAGPTDHAEAADLHALADHGDVQVPPGTVDLAVNVLDGPPPWLAERIRAALDDLPAYPDQRAARAALAAAHGRPPQECVVLNGAAEGFWLLARVLRPRLAVCVHPSFTEPERALRAAGRPVRRVLREQGTWTLDPARVPDAADLVVLGRPDNPTGAVDPLDVVAALCRPGRTVVVDEAFADFLADGQDLGGRRDLPGLVVIRSLTKLWGLAGLRIGHLLAAPDLAARLEAARQPWPVNAPALAAALACAGPDPRVADERTRRLTRVHEDRATLVAALEGIAGVEVWASPANHVLVRTPLPDLRERLLAHGLAVRRGATFPGLDPTYVRIAVRDAATTTRLAAAIRAELTSGGGRGGR